jgi:hypothetical protein
VREEAETETARAPDRELLPTNACRSHSRPVPCERIFRCAAALTTGRAQGHPKTMPGRLPIHNFGKDPQELRVEPFLIADQHGRYDYRMPPGTRWQVVSDSDLNVEVEVGYQSLIIEVHGGVDFEVTDENGVVQDFADPPLGLG